MALRIVEARRVAGMTQRELADHLGVTTRSIQNYESARVVPYKHLREIEHIAGKRSGWLLEGDDVVDELSSAIAALQDAVERHERALQNFRAQSVAVRELASAARARAEVRTPNTPEP